MRYRAYGLSIESELAFPELLPEPEAGLPPDVAFELGPVPEGLAAPACRGPVYEAEEERFLLKLRRIGRYLVEEGRRIVIDPHPEACEADLRLFLLGSCLGALLHQRGILALHASAVLTAQGAALFTGPSGVGKSTLLNALADRGYPMIADDITGLALDPEGRLRVLPGFPRTRLWSDAARTLGRDLEGLERVRAGLEKFTVPMDARFVDRPVPLSRVYQLSRGPLAGVEIAPVAPMARVRTLLAQTYRHHFLRGLEARGPHFRLVGRAAREAEVFSLHRSDLWGRGGRAAILAMSEAVAGHLGAPGAGTPS